MAQTPRSSSTRRRSRRLLAPITIVVAFVTATLVGVTSANSSTAAAVARGPVGGRTGGFADPSLVSQWYDITNR